ncbi:MAG: hypothetical protein QF791_06215, partial [Nitrospinaceae bacterium]|nr:hypothetical protein [Nitrospinaceae bacterium]
MISTGKIGEISRGFQGTERVEVRGAKTERIGSFPVRGEPLSQGAGHCTNKDPGYLNEIIASFQRTAGFALNL